MLARVAKLTRGLEGVVRLTMAGTRHPDLDLHEIDLRQALEGFDAAQLRRGRLTTGHDIQSLREEPTVRGQFVIDVMDSDLDDDEKRRVLTMGLAALAGRDDLDVL